MTKRAERKPDFSKKLLLTAVGLVAVTVPVVFGLAGATQSGVGSQTENAAVKVPAFEVVSIKLNKSGTNLFRATYTPDGFTATNIPVLMLIRLAYRLTSSLDDQFTGAPNWIKSERYDIQAKVSDSDVAELRKLSPDQHGLMLQTLLADRFNLKAHTETKELPVYALVVAKNGPEIQEAKPGDTYPDGFKGAGPDGRGGTGLIHMGPGQITGQGIPIASLAVVLTQKVGRTVLDKTGLTGKYDFTLKWTPEEIQAPMSKGVEGGGQGPDSASHADSSGPSIFTAIQEQLGLKLESQKGPVESLVIDHVERPSAN